MAPKLSANYAPNAPLALHEFPPRHGGNFSKIIGKSKQ
jgi:hypothetical protein